MFIPGSSIIETLRSTVGAECKDVEDAKESSGQEPQANQNVDRLETATDELLGSPSVAAR